MRITLTALTFFYFCFCSYAQVWEVLPKGRSVLGYRNVTTSKINSNYNQFNSENSLGVQFKVDAQILDEIPSFGGALQEVLPEHVYKELVVGEYKVDASARFNVNGFGFGYGLTDKIMFYTEITYYKAHVEADIIRVRGNTYDEVADYLEQENQNPLDATLAANLRTMVDANERTVQSFITNHYKYEPLGDWEGAGFGDTETGLMIKLIDQDVWGLMLYPGIVLPTGRVDDPDILQDIGFGDGQYDIFTEIATGYSLNDYVSFGTTLRYTYQAPTNKELRIPSDSEFTLSEDKGDFDVKYGDKINWMFNTTFAATDWLSFTPVYRFLYQMSSDYNSSYIVANDYLSQKSDKKEHQVQLTTSFSSINSFLKNDFFLPAQLNVNLVQTVAGKNVPKVQRFELELRMFF